MSFSTSSLSIRKYGSIISSQYIYRELTILTRNQGTSLIHETFHFQYSKYLILYMTAYLAITILWNTPKVQKWLKLPNSMLGLLLKTKELILDLTTPRSDRKLYLKLRAISKGKHGDTIAMDRTFRMFFKKCYQDLTYIFIIKLNSLSLMIKKKNSGETNSSKIRVTKHFLFWMKQVQLRGNLYFIWNG